jgi:YVTN family beta-propeller protein
LTLAASFCGAFFLCCLGSHAADGYQIFVSDEKSGDLTVIRGGDFKVTAPIPVGKRPRGIHASPDGKTVYVALSGTPIEPPPKLDANGNPIFQKGQEDDDDKAPADKSADGIGLVDAGQKKFLRKIPAGSDPEQFGLSPDGRKICVANEDFGVATVLDAATGQDKTLVPAGRDPESVFVPVSREPEGVEASPDGSFFYATCQVTGQLKVHPRPRSAAFLPDGSRAFIPSESAGELNVIDTKTQTVLKVITLPKGSRPMTVKVSTDGKKAYVSTGRAGTVCVVDANTYEVLNTIKVGARPWGITLSPDGKYLFSANGPSDDVSVVDLATEKEIARVKSPGSPWGVVAVPDAN